MTDDDGGPLTTMIEWLLKPMEVPRAFVLAVACFATAAILGFNAMGTVFTAVAVVLLMIDLLGTGGDGRGPNP